MKILLDKQTLELLQEELEPPIFQQLIQLYIHETEKHITNLDLHLKSSNYQEARILAHTLKGSSYSIGARTLGDLSKEMEKHLLNKEYQFAINLFNVLLRSYQESVTHLMRFIVV